MLFIVGASYLKWTLQVALVNGIDAFNVRGNMCCILCKTLQVLCVVLICTDQCIVFVVVFISYFCFQILGSATLCLRVEKELVGSTTLTLMFRPGALFLTPPNLAPFQWINLPLVCEGLNCCQ